MQNHYKTTMINIQTHSFIKYAFPITADGDRVDKSNVMGMWHSLTSHAHVPADRSLMTSLHLNQERHGYTLFTLVFPHTTQLHGHTHTHTHNNHKWHIQWHTTRLATHHKMSNTCNNMASITVNSRPLKKPWQCIHQMPHVRVLWAVLEAQLYTGVYSWDTNGCHSQFTSSICTC